MSDKPKKPQKLKARLPRGLEDRGPAAIAATREMVEKIRVVYERYGFEPVETPAFEYTDALGKFLPDQDRPNEGVFSFQDDDEQWISLRYDLTAPLARYVAENFETLAKPYRSYRFGWGFRNEKPGPGRFRQFMQVDDDKVGAPTPAADAGVRDARGISDDVQWLPVMRAVDKLDRLGIEGVKQLLGAGRKAESGDFTKGAGLQAADIALVIGSVEQGSAPVDPRLLESKTGKEGREELNEISRIAVSSGYGDDRIKVDPSVVRGLEYYTGPVFEVELLLDTKDEKGRPVRFGSVGGGGRYDGLVSRFRGEPVPATGFSIGVSRLQAALTMLGKLDTKPETGPVVVTVFDRDRVADYQKMVAALRNAGIRAELYLGNPKNMGNQLKYADRRNAPCVIIQGSDEKAKGKVQVKDLILGAGLTDTSDRDEYLKKQAEAQTEVDESEQVAAVRKILARHAVTWGS